MKKKTMLEYSDVYSSKTDVYEEFIKAEDYPKKILKFLKKETGKKIVLDLGCGQGTYAKKLAPRSKYYYCLDISEDQLKKARKNCRNIKDIAFIRSSAEKINLNNKCIDVVICTWVISVMVGFRRKLKAIREAERVLKNKGKIILVENAVSGEFEKMRGHLLRTRTYNNWLKKRGFKKVKNVKTHFKFPSVQVARIVFGEIWGGKVAKQIKSRYIKHDVVIYEKIKKV